MPIRWWPPSCPALLPAGTDNVYYEAAAVIVTLILLGRYLEAKAKGRTSEAIKRLMGLQAKTARVVRDGEARRGAARAGASPATSSRSAPARRSPVDGEVVEGSSYRGRIDDHRRAGAGRRRATAPTVVGGTINKTGSFTLPRHQGRRRHGAGPDHPHGRAGAGLEAADPGAGRPGDRVVRAGRDRGGRPHLPGLAGLRPGAGADLRAGQCRRGADHRLPLRHGTCDADLDHGRHRPRGRTRRAVPPGRGAAEPEGGRGRRPRQDRHADARAVRS